MRPKRQREDGGVSPFIKLLILVVAIGISFSALSAAFQQVTNVPLLTRPINIHRGSSGDPLINDPTIKYDDPVFLKVQNWPLPDEAVFTIKGPARTAYLRTCAYESYSEGDWSTSSTFTNYGGWVIDFINEPRSSVNLTISPIKKLYGGIPSVQDTYQIGLVPRGILSYSSENQVFRALKPIADDYVISFYDKDIKLKELLLSNVTSESKYLQIPEDVQPRLMELTDVIVQDKITPYEKALAIRNYLRDNFDYNLDSPAPEEGLDPVEFFLLDSKQGTCMHFNSALALLLRCAGIPARLVVGYMVDPDEQMQEVRAEQAHAYVEAKFDGVGWTIIDATGAGRGRDDLDIAANERASGTYVISGTVYWDINENGVNEGEYPLSDVEVVIIDSANEIASSRTNLMGMYQFDRLGSGSYLVEVILPMDWTNTSSDLVTIIVPSANMTHVDFGGCLGINMGMTATRTNITTSESAVIKGERFFTNGTVTTTDGQPVTGLKVRVFIAPSKEGARSYCGDGWVRNGEFNISSYIPKSTLAGRYQLIAMCFGNAFYNGSESDPEIRVMDSTAVLVGGSTSSLPGRTMTIYVSLMSSEEQLISYAPIEVSGDYNGSVQIEEGGIGRLSLYSDEPRTLNLTLRFSGDELHLGSSAQITARFGYIQVIKGMDTLVRGEAQIILFRLTLGGAPLRYVQIFAKVANQFIASTNSGSMGLVSLRIAIPSGWPIGNDTARISPQGFPDFDYPIKIAARTSIVTNLSDDKAVATLLDDQNLPLRGMPIRLSGSNVNVTETTDINGTATFAVASTHFENFTVVFSGSDNYLASRTYVLYSPVASWEKVWSILGLVAITAITIFGAVWALKGKPLHIKYERRRRPIKPIKKISPYKITFTQIPEDLPPVWHLGEVLTMEIYGKGEKVFLTIDDSAKKEMLLIDGKASLPLTLSNGQHHIVVRGNKGQSEVDVRIVLYGQEITSIYAQALRDMRAQLPGLSEDLTPRESQSLLSCSFGDGKKVSLEVMTSLFERAEYGPKSMGRSDYESMFRAIEEVKG